MNEIKFQRLLDEVVTNRVKKISLKHNNITGNSDGNSGQSQLHKLLKVLSNNTSVEFLDCSGTDISDVGAIGQFLSHCPAGSQSRHISEINLRRSKINDDALKTLSFAIRKNINSIGKINFSNNAISERGIKELSTALGYNSKINHLILDNNSIGYKGAKYLAEGMQKKIDRIQILSLANCDLSDQGAIEIAKVIETSEHLTEINLGYNKIGDQGAIRLAQALQNNVHIRTVNLERNIISDTGAKALFSVMQYKPNFRFLKMENNPISYDMREDIKTYEDSEENIKGISNNIQPKLQFTTQNSKSSDKSGKIIERPFEKKDIAQLIFNETKSHGIAIEEIKSPSELRLVIQKELDTGEYDKEIKEHLTYLVNLPELKPEGYPVKFYKRLNSIRLLAKTEDKEIIDSLIDSAVKDYKMLLADGDTIGTEIELKIASKKFDVRFDVFEMGKFKKSIGNEFQASVINLERYNSQFQSYISPYLAENEKTTIYHSNKIISEFKRFFTKKSQEICYHFDDIITPLYERLDVLEKKLAVLNDMELNENKTMIFSKIGGDSKESSEKNRKLKL